MGVDQRHIETINTDFDTNQYTTFNRKLQEQVSHPMARHREMNCYL